MDPYRRFRFRLVIPAFPSFNIYTAVARTTTALGPICVATAVSKLAQWDVEVIDENNCRDPLCPRDQDGRPDHERIQAERPADVVGFYGSLTSTVPRLFALAKRYRRLGARTVAGGKHVENLPDEALAEGVDVVVIGEGEETIAELLEAHRNGRGFAGIHGIAYQEDGRTVHTPPRPPIDHLDALPFPDYGLLRYAKMKMYPISRIRGCDMNCEFCAVKDRTRCESAEKSYAQVVHLVETRHARKFFDVSDHFAANRDEAIRFCNLVADYQRRTGRRLTIHVQTRLTDAKHPELLEAMRRAGVSMVCIGYESPIDEELRVMRKGYRYADMLRWTKVFHSYGFFIHGMFIFGYPAKGGSPVSLSVAERYRRFRDFIRKGRIDTTQVLHTVPLPGTDLRKRLEEEGRLYPLEQLGWEYYDGQFPLFVPDDGVEPEDLQWAILRLMRRFYGLHSLLRMLANMVVSFPIIVIPSAFTLVTLKGKHLVNAFQVWKRRFFRNDFVRTGGYFVFQRWYRAFRQGGFMERLTAAKNRLVERAREARARHGSVGPRRLPRGLSSSES